MEPARFMNRSGRSLRTKLAMLLAQCGAWTASPAGEKGDRQAAIKHAARHVLLGIFHDGKDGAWTFQGWNLMDLFDFRVRLKAEFQGSNKDLYREKLLLRSSAQ